MKITLHTITTFLSKFLHLRRMEEKNQLLDYTKFNPKKTLIFDVDETILHAPNRDYMNAEPFQPMIDKINHLWRTGYTIILFTARGQLSRNGDMNRIEKEVRPTLEDWLDRHRVDYDYLMFTKPYGAWYIDDKALTPEQFLEKQFL